MSLSFEAGCHALPLGVYSICRDAPRTPMARKKPSWKPAETFKVTKLRPNGPKEGQSVDAFIYGKTKSYQELIDNPTTKFNDLP